MEILNYSVEHEYKVSFELRLSRLEWEQYLEQTSVVLQKSRPINGFRVGTAPLSLAEAEYGDKIYAGSMQSATDGCIDKVCVERGLQPVSPPAVKIVYANAEGFCAIVSFDIYPDISGVVYKGITIEKPVHTVTDEDIMADMQAYVDRHLAVNEVQREARVNDIVEVSFKGNRNGKSFPYDHADKHRFVMGTGRLFAGLDEALLGHVAGDRLELELTMPEDFHRAEIAGDTLNLSVELRGVWGRTKQTLNDEFVKEYVKDAETVEQFASATRKTLQRRYDNRTEIQFKKNVEAAVANIVNRNIPFSMVQTVVERYWAGFCTIAKRNGKTPEEQLDEEGKTMQDYFDVVTPAALQCVKQSLAIDHIISAEKLTVTQEEMEDYYLRNAMRSGMSINEYKKASGGDETVIGRILEAKAMQFVVNHANIVEVECAADDIIQKE